MCSVYSVILLRTKYLFLCLKKCVLDECDHHEFDDSQFGFATNIAISITRDVIYHTVLNAVLPYVFVLLLGNVFLMQFLTQFYLINALIFCLMLAGFYYTSGIKISLPRFDGMF